MIRIIFLTAILVSSLAARAEVKAPGSYIARECAAEVQDLNSQGSLPHGIFVVCVGRITGLRTPNEFLRVGRTLWEMTPRSFDAPHAGSARFMLTLAGRLDGHGRLETTESEGKGVATRTIVPGMPLRVRLVLDEKEIELIAKDWEGLFVTQ